MAKNNEDDHGYAFFASSVRRISLRLVNRPFFRRFMAIALGLLCTLLLVEGALHVYGLLTHKTAVDGDEYSSGPKTRRVLCIGDSFMEGQGAPPLQSMPRQLEYLLNGNESGDKDRRRFKVYNTGKGSQNTYLVLQRFQRDIDRYQPEIVIVLAGGANFWNYQGYHLFAHRGMPLSRMLNAVERLHTVKLVRHLREVVRGNNGEKTTFRNTAVVARSPRAVTTESRKMSEQWRDRGWVAKYSGNPQEAVRCFRASLAQNPDETGSHFGLGAAYVALREPSQAVHHLRICTELDPGNHQNYFHLGLAYLLAKNEVAATAAFAAGVRVNPHDPENMNYNNLLDICRSSHTASRQNARQVLRSLALELDNDRLREIRALLEKDDGMSTLENWVASDLRKIVRLSRRRGAVVILLGYPLANPANRTIRDVAAQCGVPFVDNLLYFRQFRREGTLERYFVEDGHCGAEGYKAMAQNVYEQLREQKVLQHAAGQ